MTKPQESSQERLESAFAAFNQLSEQLSGAYRDLERRAAGLAEELARSRRDKERQRAEKERLAERLSALLDSLPGGVVVVDRNGLVRQSNAPAREWFGCELEGHDWRELLAAANVKLGEDACSLCVDDRIHLTMARSRVAGRAETIVLLTDVTEQRRLAAELDQHRRLAAMGEMAARLAHQVRTPLSSALLYADHLTHRDLDPELRQRFGGKLMDRLRDLERLTRDMLGFARGGCANGQLLTVRELFRRLHDTLAVACPEPSCLQLDAGGISAAVQADPQALTGAVCNLVENAWNAGGPGVKVTVQARLAGATRLELWVIDNGPGVPPALARSIFEPFFSARCGGTGLGLPVAVAVAEACGGTLELVPSTLPGARFVMRLPLVQIGQASNIKEIPA